VAWLRLGLNSVGQQLETRSNLKLLYLHLSLFVVFDVSSRLYLKVYVLFPGGESLGFAESETTKDNAAAMTDSQQLCISVAIG